MGAVLPLLYGPEAPTQILEDFEAAPIPELHKAMFRWVKRFTRSSWEMGPEDLDALRAQGISEAEIVRWAQIASLQGWWTMSADGGGIPLEGEAITGPVLQKPREFYEAAPEGLLAAQPGAASAGPSVQRGGERPCWVGVDPQAQAFQQTATWARERYGFLPNLLLASSLCPEVGIRHRLALELLECPQTATLPARSHALARALTTALNRSAYGAETARVQLERVSGDPFLWERVTGDYRQAEFPAEERVVLDFTAKLVRNAYKVTEKDAIAFREAGLDDAAYVEVLNVAAIQTSFDRLANALGVAKDPGPLLPKEG